MIKPTIGRVVWFRDQRNDPEGQPNAAIVCYVLSDEFVNLIVFDADGHIRREQSVVLYQGEGDKPQDMDYCEWMPYQIGQAKKETTV